MASPRPLGVGQRVRALPEHVSWLGEPLAAYVREHPDAILTVVETTQNGTLVSVRGPDGGVHGLTGEPPAPSIWVGFLNPYINGRLVP